MAPRRRSHGRYLSQSRRAGTVFVGSSSRRDRGRSYGRPRQRDPRRLAIAFGLLCVLAGLVVAAVLVQRHREGNDRRREAVAEWIAAWEKRDVDALYALTSAGSRPSAAGFARLWRESNRAAGVEAVRVGSESALSGGAVTVPVTVVTDDFGRLRGDVRIETEDAGGKATIVWSPRMRLPGLRGDEVVRRRASEPPPRGQILTSGGTDLADTFNGLGIAGTPGGDGEPATGLNRIYDDRLGGRAEQTLSFGARTIKRVEEIPGRDVHTTISPRLMNVTANALGSANGGIAVVRPRDGAVLATAGLAVSAPQAPGSTFKVITAAAALQTGIATPDRSFPVQSSATLSGVALNNAGAESCGGTLVNSFIHSCNSVFGPLGAELGAKRLVRFAEKFGFNRLSPNIPAIKESRVEPDLADDLAVGSAAIGQERDAATPLIMASVAATIANGGVRAEPRLIREEKVVDKRVVKESVADAVRGMMIGVVQGGTGTAAAVPGVTVAGKTGTAELVSTGTGAANAANTNAWFVAFAPAEAPKLAVAVMLLNAGQGGASAAPVARQVLAGGL